jgi:hypothetical protein
VLRPAVRAAAAVDRAVDWLDQIGAEKLTPHRYCWPPVQ